jgi:hypothetical protein
MQIIVTIIILNFLLFKSVIQFLPPKKMPNQYDTKIPNRRAFDANVKVFGTGLFISPAKFLPPTLAINSKILNVIGVPNNAKQKDINK